ncbi:MAG: AI-2E family transporter [Ruminococcaceae bacterium]|nr:AI-2E family transporter [Oscillospiraceae bacterium]
MGVFLMSENKLSVHSNNRSSSTPDPRLTRRKTFLINFAYFAAIACIIYVCAIYLINLALPFLLGLAIALILKPAVDSLSSLLKLKRKPMAVAVTTLLYISAAGFLCLLLLFAVNSLGKLFLRLPDLYTNNIAPSLEKLESLLTRFGGDKFSSLLTDGTLSGVAEQFTARLVETGTAAAAKLPSAMLTATFTIVFSLFICADYNTVTDFLARQLPPKHRHWLFDTKSLLLQGVSKMLCSYLLLMFITFLLLLAAFWLLGISSPVSSAAMIAVLDALPLLGTGTVLIPWALLEFIRGNITLGTALLLTYVIITVVRNLLEPRLIGKNTGLDSVAALFSMYLGWRLFGFWGLFLMPLLFLVLSRLNESGKLRLWVKKS